MSNPVEIKIHVRITLISTVCQLYTYIVLIIVTMTDSTNLAMFYLYTCNAYILQDCLLKNLIVGLCKFVVKVWGFYFEIWFGTKLTKSKTLHDPKKKGNIRRIVLLNVTLNERKLI